MKNNNDNGSGALTDSKTSALSEAHSAPALTSLGDLTRPNGETAPERRIVTVLYGTSDSGFDRLLHRSATKALAGSCDIFPVYEGHEGQIRHLWTQRKFDCAILVLNNIQVDDGFGWPGRQEEVLALIQWLHSHGSVAIMALCGIPGSKEEALRSGADAFFDLPYPSEEFNKFLSDRFAPTQNGVADAA